MHDDAIAAVPQETGVLIDLILTEDGGAETRPVSKAYR
jgi:hypothetical protein